MTYRYTLRRKSRLLPILVIILLVLAVMVDYRGWRLFLLALGGAWLFSYYWARSLAENLRIRREMRFGWAQVGDRLEERFTLSNKSALPGIWVELVDHSDVPEYHITIATGIEGNSDVQWRTHGLCNRRGLFTLGPTTLRTSDPLGLYDIEIHNPQSVSLMVTPPIVPLPEIEVAPGGRAGEGRPRPNAPERTVSAAGVREFQPGDSLRWVHWPTSARRDNYYVRLFDSTPSGDWWIILDVDQDVQVGEGADSTAEHSIILAASLADRGIRMGRAVGLVAHGEPLVWLPPREGNGQRWEILRSLALLTPARRPMADMLAGIRPTLGRFTSLVIITSNVQGQWIESLLPSLWQGAVPTVLLLDPVAFGGDGDKGPIIEELARWGIYRYVITPDLLNRPEAQPGRKGKWEWRITPTGRAIPVNPPRDTSWKIISK